MEEENIFRGKGKYDWGKENVFLVREEYVWGRGICLGEGNVFGRGEYLWGMRIFVICWSGGIG